MTEQSIQAKIKRKLTGEGWTVIKLIKTSMNGIPDLMAIRDGEVQFIEVKQVGGRVTPLQAERHRELREQGITVKIWTDHEQAFTGGK
jgi:Holliday junction resolvase